VITDLAIAAAFHTSGSQAGAQILAKGGSARR
jgi:gamma-glutamyltranspeptidase